LKPVTTAGPYVDLARVAEDLVRRMRELRHSTGGGVYLIADREGRIYLLAEAASHAPATLKQLPAADLVGVYTHPVSSQIAEDLARHLCDNGVVTEQVIYDAVRHVEG